MHREILSHTDAQTSLQGQIQEVENGYIAYEGDLRRYAAYLCRNRDEADDLVQEIFIRAIENADRFQAGTNIKNWLLTMMRNLFFNQYKRKQVYNRICKSLNDPEVDETRTEDDIDPFARERIADALGNLFEQHRKILIETDVKGRTYRQAATTLGIPIGTVLSGTFRAHKKLAEILASVGKEYGFKKRTEFHE